MLRNACVNNLSIGKHLLLLPHEYYLSTSSLSSVKVEKEVNSFDINPPYKRYKNSTSVLRALISCVQPIPEAPHFQLGPDYSYLSIFRTRYHLLARAKGRLAARVSARDFFPNDITTLSKEIPRIDRWVPIQTPDDIIKRAVDGSLSNDEAMDRLILLLAPIHSWKLYNDIAPDHKWSSDTLHRLLDLLCVTNGGQGGFYSHLLLDDYNWSNLPDPDEVYLADNFLVLSRPDNYVQNITGRNQLDSDDIVDKVGDDVDVDNVAGGTVSLSSKHSSNIWSMQTTAERLFHKEHKILNTPQAYRSIIRGAARFKNADRALEMAKIAWSSKYGDKCLDITTYSLLLRSLHGLTSVRTRKENVWDIILSTLEHVKTCGEPINISIYTNILYTLAQTTVMLKSSSPSSSSLNPNYVPIGLGILGEVKRLNFKPELGTLANLLLLIYETPIPVNQSSIMTTKDVINEKGKKLGMNRSTYASYNCSNLLNQFLNDLEVYFNNNNATVDINSTTRINDSCSGGSPKRFDAWTIDDYTFFPIAMKCALNETNIELGERIHQLLTQYEDRTFLLSSSKMKYQYIHDYCRLMFYHEKYEQKNNYQLIQRYYNTYCQYFNVIISSKILVEYLIKRYTRILNLRNNDNNNIRKNQYQKLNELQVEDIDSLKVNVYNYLCRLLDDILNIEIHYYLQKSLDTIEYLTGILCDYATVNPIDALEMSVKILHISKKLENDFQKPIKTGDTSVSYDNTGAKIDKSYLKNYKLLVKININKSIRLAFPIIEIFTPSEYENINNNSNNARSIQNEDRLIQKTKLIDTLHEWFNYAEKNHLISWEWAPKGLSILWKEDEFLQIDFMWNVIQHLAKQSDKCIDCDADERRLLKPILDILEQSVSVKSSDDIEIDQRLKWLKIVRTVLDKTDNPDGIFNEQLRKVS